MNLEGTYSVCHNGQIVGTATLRRLGLYYDVTCLCQPAGEQMLHLVMRGTNFSEDLGLLIPQGEMLELRKRIPVKRILDQVSEFTLRKRTALPEEFIQITPKEEFPYLQRLNCCIFAEQDGRKGVIFLPQK